ncbi:MAG TPA: error-prone DNA polymerase [Cyclobacteriaceae bacterium]|nr:error-prone DNA polymerase [Cyclobacteriaceae bacterium]HMV09319.1 error-prone DNA polymerase [Cyclobacteriaceae bacterium]HMX01880.1 error-prone DNA polymerase [Cyclobacteriaceae bacterium]HMX50804.1 error-prone DNA polymerase [Cyclobacteriaceae bacterium]HMY94704.1 error-prone DNA polymerase [Cyclobacteriaceae bacterium]
MKYTELQVTSNFSFLRGASHPEEMVDQAVALGYNAIAITDRNTFAGIVRAHAAAKKAGIRLIPACRLDLMDGPSLLAFPTDIKAYAQISALLTLGNLRAEKGSCHLYKADVYAHAVGSKFIVIPQATLNENFDFEDDFKNQVREFRENLGDQLSIAVSRAYNGDDSKMLARIHQLAVRFRIPMVATNDVHYHNLMRRELQDIVTCVREKCTIHNAGFKLHPNAERYLKPNEEMLRLFRQYPDAIREAQKIAEACMFSLDQLKYQYPKEITSEGRTPQEELVYLTWEGANRIFNNAIPDKVKATIEYELTFIAQVNYAEYFLTVYDIVRFAREKKILCQGRGSAANSTVCYCLGITSVDPSKFDLLFERFISSARNEPPDIDVDFEHERREEVMQYIYEKYGRDRAAIVATVTQQHHRGAIRDVGKAMGLSVDTIKQLSGLIWDFRDEGFDKKRIAEQGLNPNDKTIQKVLELTSQFMGFPRQLGQHTGGFVITEGKLSDLCPVLNARMENRTNIEWNKDDIEALGFLKIDVLALGMLTCIRKAFDLAKQHYNLDLTLANIPQDDSKVYEMTSRGDTIGVFQIESRAQKSMLPRLRPKCFYDLVIEVAIVRPGPIQGDMVHPYLRRRNGEEPVEYPSKELEDILKRTLGVPLFQEQAMKIAIVAASFTPSEADELRRSMATFKAKGKVSYFQEKLISGMIRNGYTEAYAQRVFRQLEGFGSYGFPESHAVSFALLVYVSAWTKCYYPDIFCCALLNSYPMGFYEPAQLIIDAQNHGVEMLPVDINYSNWDNTLEIKADKYYQLRLGFRQVKGLREDEMKLLIGSRQAGYRSVNQLRKAGLSDASLELLADADAFRSIGLDRREALWDASTQDKPLSLFDTQQSNKSEEGKISLPKMSLSEHVVQDYATLGLSLKAHPVSFVREQLSSLHVTRNSDLSKAQDGDIVKVAGLILVRQRPGTASGICFITLEDETGDANLVVFAKLFDEYRKEIIQSKLLMVEGKLQKEGEVIHVIVKRCFNVTGLLGKLTASAELNLEVQRSRADETTSPFQGKMFPDGRNFR